MKTMNEKYPVYKLDYDSDAEWALRKEVYRPSFFYRDPLLIESVNGGYHTKPVDRAKWNCDDPDPELQSHGLEQFL